MSDVIEEVTVNPTDQPPWWQKINPLWWLQTGGSNSSWTAPTVNNGQPWLPNVTNPIIRNLLWWLRNPCGNFIGFVIGFEGCRYNVKGPAPVLATTWRDVGNGDRNGWKWALINGWAPFVSYWGGTSTKPGLEFYQGWRPASGGYGIKIVWRQNAGSDQPPKA